MKNHLHNQISPYLLQHAENPVDWYPWGSEAFDKARNENKPVFLSIGYSTCHWCHVMAHESFENLRIAEILNKDFVSIKVDKEERPDIDSIYMSVCQAMTGSGGWPTSIFMTPDQKPFYAGTYYPPRSKYGMPGFEELISAIRDKWKNDRGELESSAEQIVKHLSKKAENKSEINDGLIESAFEIFSSNFDVQFAGFGEEPKFPSPHNLIFLMDYYHHTNNKDALEMAEKTLIQMYRGGIFDHIGGGFSRYSTDKLYLVPHFEKMLYDNALLIYAYSKAYYITQKDIYKKIAEKTADYILREMTAPDGGFYCAQDADSDGVEGKYYVFSYDEIMNFLGSEGKKFTEHYDITPNGNFEGKNIPNLLKSDEIDNHFEGAVSKLYEYRKKRAQLHLDDKILTSWNSLAIVAFSYLFRVSGIKKYLEAAEKAADFIDKKMTAGQKLFVSFRNGKNNGENGFLDDYASYIFALISLYEATLDKKYLNNAQVLCKKAVDNFHDTENGGFSLNGKDNEKLIYSPIETYDGAIPSGNSVMAYNLIKLSIYMKDEFFENIAENQLKFMSGEAKKYPAGFSFFLSAMLLYIYPPETVTVVTAKKEELCDIAKKFDINTAITVLDQPTEEYKIINEKTTFYVCKNKSCQPPVNDI